jgi:hypothetical protein
MESKRKKTSEKKYFDTIKVSEKSTNYIFGESEIDRKQFAKNMEIICQRCNGTGTDPDYKEVNVILAAIDDIGQECKKNVCEGEWSFQYIFDNYQHGATRNAPFCLSCHYMKKIDREQFVSGDYKQVLMDSKNEIQKWFLYDVDPFLRYIRNGEVWCKSGKKVHFDLEKNRWIEVSDFNENIDSVKAVYKWLHRFKAAGYWDFRHFDNLPIDPTNLCWPYPRGHIEALTNELILCESITIERLIEIKNDINLFTLGNHALEIITDAYNVSKTLPAGFKFTWENILRKFDLPLSHLHLFESDDIRSEK